MLSKKQNIYQKGADIVKQFTVKEHEVLTRMFFSFMNKGHWIGYMIQDNSRPLQTMPRFFFFFF